MDNKLVSVIMPTYNTKITFLQSAIKSILNQSYKNFEFIIIDDGSTAEDYEILKSYNDSRMKIYKNNENFGLSYTLNRALKIANGTLIFRMDSDDISKKNRISEMVEYFTQNPKIDIAGSQLVKLGNPLKKIYYPKTNQEIRSTLLFKSPLGHPSVVFKKSSIDKYQLRYNENLKAEDYDLWTRCIFDHDLVFGNIEKALLIHRSHPGQLTRVNNFVSDSSSAIINNIIDNLKLDWDKKTRDFYLDFAQFRRELTYDDIQKVECLFEELKPSVLDRLKIDEAVFKNIFAEKVAKESIRQYLRYSSREGAHSFKNSSFFHEKNLPTKYRLAIEYITIIRRKRK